MNPKAVAKWRNRETVKDRAKGATIEGSDRCREGNHRVVQTGHLVTAGQLPPYAGTDDDTSDAFGAT